MRLFSSIALRTLLIGLVVGLCVAPVLYGYAALFENPDSFRTAFGQGAVTRLIRSFLCATLVAAAATAIGVPLGLSWAAGRGRFHAFLAVLSITPLVLPPYVYALAWIEIAGAARASGVAPELSLYSLSGVVLVQSLRLAPVAAGAIWLAVRFADSSQVEAALLGRGRGAAFMSVVVPARLPVLIAAPLLTFILAFSDYAIASLLQVDLYPIDIQTRFSAHFDSAGAFALTLPILAIAAVALLVWVAVARRGSSAADSDTGGATDAIPLVPLRVAMACTAGFIAVALGGPLSVAILRTGSSRALVEAFQSLSSEMAFSIGIALACALTALLLSMAIAVCFRRVAPLWVAAAIPLLVTGPAFGIGAILLWNHADWRGAVYDSPTILVLTGTARVAVIGMMGAAVGLAARPRDLDHAAELAGRSMLSRLLHISLPMAAPALLLAYALMMLFAFADVDTAALVAPPGSTPLAVRIAGLLHYGPSDFIHAASLLSAAVALVTMGLAAFAVRQLATRTS